MLDLPEERLISQMARKKIDDAVFNRVISLYETSPMYTITDASEDLNLSYFETIDLLKFNRIINDVNREIEKDHIITKIKFRVARDNYDMYPTIDLNVTQRILYTIKIYIIEFRATVYEMLENVKKKSKIAYENYSKVIFSIMNEFINKFFNFIISKIIRVC